MNLQIFLGCLLAAGLSNGTHGQQSSSSPRALETHGDTQYVHDPAIIREGASWFLFSTANGPERNGEIPIRCSQDLHQWQKCGYVFTEIPQWIKKESPETKELWAPDISYFNGEYHLYYAFSVFGKNTSGIALLTNKTLNPRSPDFLWVDRGLVLRSRLEDDFNAIDPSLVSGPSGTKYLIFGSFWSGIKLIPLDPATGKTLSSVSLGTSLPHFSSPSMTGSQAFLGTSAGVVAVAGA